MIKHIVRAQQFDKEFLKNLFEKTDRMKNITNSDILKEKIMATLFYEPSTRTRLSFETAMHRLGGKVISTENAKDFSSAVKGETLKDTISIVSNYADVIVLRHYEDDASEQAIEVSKVPIINAGSGKGQHPTQTLLDLYTINDELKKIDGISIAMVGDLKRGRTVRSLSYVLTKFDNIKIYFVSPENCRMEDDIKEYLTTKGVEWHEINDLNKVLPLVDCVYMTRIQKERFENEEEYLKAKGKYVINNSNINLMKETAILLHPLPRVDEISPEVDDNIRSKYFKQAENGLFVRMALLKYVLFNK